MEKTFGLLGEKLSHSLSPEIHHMLGNDRYFLFEKKPHEVEDFIKQGSFSGLNVTIPYKKTVMKFCSELTPAAMEVGAVNTIIRKPDGGLIGDNTDVDGFRSMVEQLDFDPADKNTYIFGSGGASATVQYVMKKLGANVTVVSRTGETNYENMPFDGDIFINATPVGMYPNNGTSPVDKNRLIGGVASLDLIYNPIRTQFLMDAEHVGHYTCNGLRMLVVQAVEAAKRWGFECNIDTEKIIRTINTKMSNLILIGMPGSGKSTIGKIAAKKLGREFVDSDQEIVKRIDMTIPEYFEKFGEASFREVETEVLSDLGKKNGLVISTGGGCVTRGENLPSLNQNGVVLFVERDVSKLARDGRPLSVNGDLSRMYAERRVLYNMFADMTINNNGELNSAAESAMEAFYEIAGY